MAVIESQLSDILKLMKEVDERLKEGHVATPDESALIQDLHVFFQERGRSFRAFAISNYLTKHGVDNNVIKALAIAFNITVGRVYQIAGELPIYKESRDKIEPQKYATNSANIARRINGSEDLTSVIKRSSSRRRLEKKPFNNGLDDNAESSFKNPKDR